MDAQEALQRLDAHITDIGIDIAQLNDMMLLDEDIDARIASLDASRARLVAMRSSTALSSRSIQRYAFICAISRIPTEYADFGEELPDNDGDASPATAEEVARALVALDLHNRSATSFVNRVAAILTRGPELSMNIPLAPGEMLPAALHTLNQGALWACLLGGGANPDLEDRMRNQYQEERLDESETHDVRKALTPEAKCLWFLCKKFFFSLSIANKDGECYQWKDEEFEFCYLYRMYMGRLFVFDSEFADPSFTRARIPRALEVYSHQNSHIARTLKGLWGWGEIRVGQLGFKSERYEYIIPTCLTFPACPKVAKLEASLPPWEKHAIVTDMSMKGNCTFILTPVGTVMAGDIDWFTGRKGRAYVGPIEEENKHLFHPVAVPAGFVPDHIMHLQGPRPLHSGTVILSMGDRQMISGSNMYGQLGLGHKNEMSGFVNLPFRVDQIMTEACGFNVFLSGHQLLFAGEVPHHIAHLGLLPQFSKDDICLTPTPLRFPERVKGFFASNQYLIWVTEGQTHFQLGWGYSTSVIPFEAAAFLESILGVFFCDASGQWSWDDALYGSGKLDEMNLFKGHFRQFRIHTTDVDP
ncbi:ATPase AAA [Carpediemonas membranifera]|uniref:ATPase AAA n=1 Tax=Carpediemonas membranifera TaxID=201153 RepID=A0A8J6E5R8_9EUKA|nr:ATPase AAA [Carpediemonas membranifera]|eukprot:KAG9396202.1 ATPase AAA [Carpediemonas membranifera]